MPRCVYLYLMPIFVYRRETQRNATHQNQVHVKGRRGIRSHTVNFAFEMLLSGATLIHNRAPHNRGGNPTLSF